MGERHDRTREVWVIVRVDLFQLRDGTPDDPRTFVTVKEVVGTEAEAQAEVARLTSLQADKDVVYFSEPGRWLAR